MDISALKKSRATTLQKLNKAIEDSQKGGGGSNEDTRFWQPKVDEAGNGYAVIRFLPAPPNDDFPWVKVYNRAFQGSGGWYIENDLSTVGLPDPCGEMTGRLWGTGLESDKDLARKYKRKMSYICNIYVVRDPAAPENEGKIKLFKFGQKIFDKLTQAVRPEFEDEAAFDPFDLWSGANFKVKIRKVEGYRNYDKSEFEAPGALLDDDQALEKIWNSEFTLTEFTDKSDKNKFKSYEELCKRLAKVLGSTVGSGISVLSAGVTVAQKEPESTKEKFESRTAKKQVEEEEQKPAAKVVVEAKKPEVQADDDGEDVEEFFKNLQKAR